jgi:hypothetical protein
MPSMRGKVGQTNDFSAQRYFLWQNQTFSSITYQTINEGPSGRGIINLCLNVHRKGSRELELFLKSRRREVDYSIYEVR